MNITVPDLTPTQCAQIAITAAEGGINYWAVVDGYDWKTFDPYGEPPVNIPAGQVFYTIVSDTDGDEIDSEIGGPYRVSVQSINDGYQLVLEGHCRRDLVSQALDCLLNREPGAVDADAADCIIQLGLFGEIIYG